MKEASRILQIESIQELNQKIEALEKKQEEMDVLITELKTDRKSLEMKLKGKTTLTSYLLFLFRKTQNVLNESHELIENHASEVQNLHAKLEECKESNNAHKLIVSKKQQTIEMEKENFAHLENLISLEQNITNKFS